MYDTQYNRKIAKEIDRLNKEYIKHSKSLEGGHKKGQKKYNNGTVISVANCYKKSRQATYKE